MSSDKTKGLFAYSGAVKTEDFQLGKLLDNEELGEITFNLDVHGRHIADHLPAVELKGLIASIDIADIDMKISHWTENTNKADLMERLRWMILMALFI